MGPNVENDFLRCAFYLKPPRDTPYLVMGSEGFGPHHAARKMCERLNLAIFAVTAYNESCNPNHVIGARWIAKCERVDDKMWKVWIEVRVLSPVRIVSPMSPASAKRIRDWMTSEGMNPPGYQRPSIYEDGEGERCTEPDEGIK